jgi:tetratricopeptide (TPR) repeat protein
MSHLGEERDPESALANAWQRGSVFYLYNLINAQQWDRALEEIGNQLAEDPEDVELHTMRGLVLRKLGRFDESEKQLKKVIALAPDDDDGFVELSKTYLDMNRAGLADEMVRQALRLNPENEVSWILLGQLSLHYSDTQMALRCADQIKRLNPESTAAMEIRTRALAETEGKQKIPADEQIREYQSILEVEPENERALVLLGEVHLNELKDYEKAEEYFRSALRIDPSDKSYQKLLIATLRKKDPILKLLWLPHRPFHWILQFYSWCWKEKWPLIIQFFVGKYAIILLSLSGLMFFALFWPITKMYEYLTIADLHRKLGRVTLHRGPFARLHQSSFTLRFCFFLLGVLLFWGCITAFFVNEKTRGHVLTGIAVLVGFGATALVFLGWGSFIYDFIRGKIRARKNRHLP